MARRRGLRRLLVLGLALALIAGGDLHGRGLYPAIGNAGCRTCTAAVGSAKAELATDQAANAALITAVAVRRGLPPRAASIALATAMQESKLRNIGHGDQAGPDSRGLFQQRPSQGWGTEEQVMDPVLCERRVLRRPGEDPRVRVAGNHRRRAAGPALGLPAGLRPARGHGPGLRLRPDRAVHAALDCTLKSPEGPGDAQSVVGELTAAFGNVPATADGSTIVLDGRAAARPGPWRSGRWPTRSPWP